MFERSRSLQIYMKPGIKEDDLLLRVWDASRKSDRPQDVFRSMLRAGLIAMLESGDMPEAIIEECGLDALLERHRRRTQKGAKEQQAHMPAVMPAPYPYQQPAPMPPYITPQASPMPAQAHTAPYVSPEPQRPVEHQQEPQRQREEPRTIVEAQPRPNIVKEESPKSPGGVQSKKEKYGNMM